MTKESNAFALEGLFSYPFHLMRASQAANGALWDLHDWMVKEGREWWEHCRDQSVEQWWNAKLKQLETWLDLKCGDLDRSIADQFGFRFDDGHWIRLGQTERLELWLVREFAKLRDRVPVILVPPMVLDPGVMAWEPGRSFVHYLADREIPTAVIINRDIQSHRAVRQMTLEEYILDVRRLTQIASEAFNGTQVVMGGYCQGGEVAMRCLASGRLKGLVRYGFFGVIPLNPCGIGDLYDNYKHLPPWLKLQDACVRFPEGDFAVSGQVMRDVINYCNPAVNNPVSDFIREWIMCRPPGPRKGVLKMWHWLNRTVPIPYHIVEHTNANYREPIVDGVYPMPVFGEKADLKRLGEYGIRAMFLGTALRDTLVRPEASTFLEDLLEGTVDVHVCQYDKGHLGMLRDCVLPDSDEPLDGYSLRGEEGPVLWYRRVVRPHPVDR